MNKFLKSVIALGVASSILSFTSQGATYQVVDTTSITSHKYTKSKALNAEGSMAIAASSRYNFPVQFDLLTENDFQAIENLAALTNETNTLLNDIEDSAALRAGTPTGNDFAWVIKYLQESKQVNNSLYQKLGDNNVVLNQNGVNTDITIFDQALPSGDLSKSTNDFTYGITSDNWLYGRASAPYLPNDFTDSNGNELTYWTREFSSRGFLTLDNGNTIKSVIPPENNYGGESGILKINDNHVGVGYVSTSIKQTVLDSITSDSGGCADPEVLKNITFAVCVEQAKQSAGSGGAYSLEAAKFTFDEQGNVTNTELLGNLVTPNIDDARVFKSYAQAINNHGVAVGFATGWLFNDVTEPSSNERTNLYAVMYKDGKAISFTKDSEKEFDSRAFDINDAGIAVGHVTKSINGSFRTKFYYVDTNNPELNLVLPKDFFTGSASTASAINEQGLIVGEGEVETHSDTSTNPRRRHGFLYDMNSDKFSDLNSFLSCNSDYTIISASDINENNEISATAVVKVDRRDAYGNLIKDSNGNQLSEDVFRAVTLKPIAGEVEDCSKVEEKIKRRGAGFGLFSLLLLPLVMIRRYKK